MAYDVYMYFNGKGALGTTVIGETSDKDMSANKALEILSFSLGASNPATIGSAAGGAGSGKVDISAFNVMKHTDSASTSLFQACCKGDHFPEVVVVLRKSGAGAGNENVFLTYTFKKVFVDNVQWSGSTGGDNTPTESVSFSFGSIKIEYKKQDAKGKLAPAGETMWSVITNTASQTV